MTNPVKKLLIALGVLCIIALIVLILYWRLAPSTSNRDIAGSIEITSQWLEIKPEPPLNSSKKIQLVLLELAGDYTPDFQSQGIRFSDGLSVVPEVQLVDENGKVFPLKLVMVNHRDRSGSSVMARVGFGAPDLPQDKDYRMVRIRSDKPIECSRIVWQNRSR